MALMSYSIFIIESLGQSFPMDASVVPSSVYKDGMPTMDYVLADALLTVGESFYIGDSMTVAYPVSAKKAVGTSGLCAFRLYGQSQYLKFNQKYMFHVRLGREKRKIAFTSRFSPSYVSSKKVRTDTGDLLAGVGEEQINYMIYQNSKEFDLSLADAQDNDVDLTEVNIDNVRMNWVRYKTILDLIHAAYLTISGAYGTVEKKIGPIDVAKTVKLPLLASMTKKFQDLFDSYDQQLHEAAATNIAFIKAGDDYAFPLAERRSF